jgi:ABC-type polysaccharide/polyol phosphate transport system ATPase subunit
MAKISLDDVSLTFDVRQNSKITLKEFVVQCMFRRVGRERMQVRALQNVSFMIDEGQRVGIIGHNGAGKSTLLRLLAGIYPPSSGERLVEGHISSLFDIALGFEGEASGWENIGFRSYLQGETPKTIKDKIQPIAEFSELGDFLKMPVRYYSAGMAVRLAFSIATAIEPEILLVDEVLSVGDMAFQDKARRRMYEMMSKAKIIVMVSHDLSSIKKLCDQVIWMEHGTVREIGPASAVIASYTRAVHGGGQLAA